MWTDLQSYAGDLHMARNMLWKAASPTRWDWQAVGVPLTPAQNQALTVTSGAIDEARAAVDRATGALSETLRSDDPPTR